jgi:uncharacterized protein YggE
MRNKVLLITGFVLLAAGLVAWGGRAFAQTPQPAAQPAPRTLSVTGRGEVLLTPDIAQISIGVRTESEDVAEAMASNTSQVQEVIDVLVAQGVSERDIQTNNFSIYPQQQYDEKGQVIATAFIVENTVNVTVRDLESLGALLDAAVTSGANSIYGIQFDLEDKTEATSEARQAAVENARAQAEELAQAAGVTLGEIQSINAYSTTPGPIFYGRGGVAEQAAADVPISPGQLSITVEVNVIYTIE